MKKFLILIALLIPTISFANSHVSEDILSTKALHPKQLRWNFDGVFGSLDRAAAQRGFQVYKEICASCHGLKLVAYRNLQEIGFLEEEVKQIAAEYSVVDGPNDDGDMFDRPALPSDRFVGPYANENAARASNGGASPPDLSLIIKARHDGANYVYSLITGFKDAPEGFAMAEGKSYNPYFEGRQISMPAPISDDGQVDYRDGTYASKEQMTMDVVNFLQWAAEPEMEHRNKMGIRTMIFLGLLLIVLLAAKKLVWKNIK